VATVTWQGDDSALWSLGSNWDTGTKPAAGDDVVMNNAANCTLDEETADLKSLVMTGYTGAFSGSSNIRVKPGAAVTGTVTLVGASTYTGTVICDAGSTGGKINVSALTTAGSIAVGEVSSHTGDTYFLGNISIPATKTVTLSYGTLHTDGATDDSGLTHSWGLFSSSNSNTRTLTLGNSTISITSSASNAWDCSTATNLTVTTAGNTSTLLFPNAPVKLSMGAKSYYNITYTGPATKTGVLTWGSNGATILSGGTWAFNGNSATNRLLIQANSLGGTNGVTNTGTFTGQHLDIRDFQLSNAIDLSTITGNSGDCGGNTGITFTTAATQTATGNSANWSAATWSGRVPLPQDDVVLSLTAGQTLTNDMPRMGKSISVTTAMNLTTGIAVTNYGSLNLTNLNTYTQSSSWTFEGRGAFTLTSAGKTFAGFTVAMVGGSLTPQDATAISSVGFLTVTTGGFLNTGDFSVSVASRPEFSGSSTKSITLGAATWTITADSGTIFNAGATGTTFNSTGSTILISDTGASNKSFAGAGLTYNDLSISGGGAGAVIITGANSFNELRISGGTKSITLPGSTTTTINDGGSLGNGTDLITFTASAGSATISKPTGVLEWDYVSLTNIPSTGGATFYAGANSTDGGGNTGWIFADGPEPEATGGPSRALMYTQGWT